MENDYKKLSEFKNLSAHYTTHRNISKKKIGINSRGRSIYEYISRQGIMTDLGDIEVNEWEKRAFELINKYDELHIYEKLLEYAKSIIWMKEPSLRSYTLQLHMMRIFERKEWVDYKEFHDIKEQEFTTMGNDNLINLNDKLELLLDKRKKIKHLIEQKINDISQLKYYNER